MNHDASLKNLSAEKTPNFLTIVHQETVVFVNIYLLQKIFLFKYIEGTIAKIR